MKHQQLKVLELFAGVGGFRIGLENSNPDLYQTKWANQWEPSRKSQDAFEVYNYHFPNSKNLNLSIEEITDAELKNMDADIIVGGFPCQDYSVARSKKSEKGIEGKKGVLFWEIIRATRQIMPKYLILENVDRLLKSPSKQRGRDFAIMLSAFNSLGYSVEWRVINAAEYGGVQRRRRVFFFIYRNDTDFGKLIDSKYGIPLQNKDSSWTEDNFDGYMLQDGLFARQFQVKQEAKYDGSSPRHYSDRLPDDILEISEHFTGKVWNTGIMRYGQYFTMDTQPTDEELTKVRKLGSIIQSIDEVDEKYYINNQEKLEKFVYLRGPKKINRTTPDGHAWVYSEGGMSPVDDFDSPGRTMLTSEGSVNRSTHFLKINNRYRLLTPIEAERLNDFPSDWTRYKLTGGKCTEVSDRMRYFFMGNALVTGVVKRIADELQKIELENK